MHRVSYFNLKFYLQIYKDKGWNLAEDHIHFTIGRQAANLRMTDLSVQAFARLFNPASKQSPPQQAAFLREYLQTYQVTFSTVRIQLIQCTFLDIPWPL